MLSTLLTPCKHKPPAWQLLCMPVCCMTCHRQWYFLRLHGALHHSRLVVRHAESYKQLANCDHWNNVEMKWAIYLLVTYCRLKGEKSVILQLQKKSSKMCLRITNTSGSRTWCTILDVNGGEGVAVAPKDQSHFHSLLPLSFHIWQKTSALSRLYSLTVSKWKFFFCINL